MEKSFFYVLNFAETMKRFRAAYPDYGVDVERISSTPSLVKATIRDKNGMIISAAHYTSGDDIMWVEENAILRAIEMIAPFYNVADAD